MLSKVVKRLKYLWRRPAGDKVLVVQAFVLLGVTRLAIKTVSFKRLERFMGDRMVESTRDLAGADLRNARRVGWAVRGVSGYTPWESNCFPQALTAKILLRRRGIDATLYLGAAFAEDKRELKAHAWLRCGELYLTGGDGGEQFGAIASFA